MRRGHKTTNHEMKHFVNFAETEFKSLAEQSGINIQT
jgi:hypothetical protein